MDSGGPESLSCLFRNVSIPRGAVTIANERMALVCRVATVRAALEVKQVFEQLAQAEKSGVTPEQRKRLEEQAAEKVRGFFGPC